MTHKIRHKQLSKIQKKYKNLAGIVAAATILSTAILPGMPTTIAHASANSNSSTMSATTSQQIGKTTDSGIQINFNSTVLPTSELNAQSKTPQLAKEVKQESKAPQLNPNVNNSPVTTSIPTEQANPNVQPDPNVNNTPVTISTPTKQANPNAQPDPNVNSTPVTISTPTEQANPNIQPDPNVNNTPVTISTPTEQANPNIQPDPNVNNTPVTTSTPTEQANPNAQPDPNVNNTPVTTSIPTEQANPNAQPDPNVNNTPVTTSIPTEQANPNVQPASTITKSSPGNAPTNYKQVLDIKATAYAPGPHDNAQWGNKTYIGSQVRPGIIAVDPNVIPLGSRVYIQYPNGHGEYAVAEDTGGAIKGNRVDIAKWTVNEAQDFGIQNVKVYVISTPEKI